MVIGNGFFADTKEDARAEMQKRKGGKVDLIEVLSGEKQKQYLRLYYNKQLRDK